MIEIKIPDGAQEIIDTLYDNGYEAYVVGGCVRDSILGKIPKDWDICTSATTEEIKKCFYGNYIVETGIKHGTITIIKNSVQYEVTTFRIDGIYSDGRHPDDVIFTTNLADDLARRDFTINAMAYNHSVGLVDLYNGQEDIESRIIRCVGDPNERFAEDALRIMRALRFASQLEFEIDTSTHNSILMNYRRLNYVSKERINTELCKTLLGKQILPILENYKCVFEYIIPPFKKCIGFEQNNKFHIYNVYDHIAHAVSNYQGDDVTVKIALLLHDIGKPMCYTEDENGGHFYNHNVFSHYLASKVLDDLKFSNVIKNDVLELIEFHDSEVAPTAKSIKRWLNKVGEKQFKRLLDVKAADILAHNPLTQASRMATNIGLGVLLEDILETNQCFTVKDLDINGKDIMSLGVKEGKLVGDILNHLLDCVINETISNNKDELTQQAQKYIESRC